MVGYNVQVAVDTEYHIIVADEVTNVGSDRAQLSGMATTIKTVLGVDHLDVVPDRGYFSGKQILANEQAGVTAALPKPQTSRARYEGRFGKPDFVYVPEQDVCRCPAGEMLKNRLQSEERVLKINRYWASTCQTCAIKSRCTPGKERRVSRWEHEDVIEAYSTGSMPIRPLVPSSREWATPFSSPELNRAFPPKRCSTSSPTTSLASSTSWEHETC